MAETCHRCGGTGVERDLRAEGARIREARVARGMSLRDLARRVGCSAAYVSDVERGQRACGTGPVGNAILSAVSMTREELTDD